MFYDRGTAADKKPRRVGKYVTDCSEIAAAIFLELFHASNLRFARPR